MVKRTHIAGASFEDVEGLPWFRHAQRGWTRADVNSRAVRADRCVRTLRRLAKLDPERTRRVCRRLDGQGWWASYAVFGS